MYVYVCINIYIYINTYVCIYACTYTSLDRYPSTSRRIPLQHSNLEPAKQVTNGYL